jgi:2'-5' RNA ligase
MRLFVAIALEPALQAELERTVNRLRARDDGLRWTRPRNWHITLQFLGETSAAVYPLLAARLAQVRDRALPVALDALEIFERSGVAVVCVKLTAELAALQRAVVAATCQCGFKPEARPYQPHITLARTREGVRGGLTALKSRLAGAKCFPGFTAREFLLYQSVLAPDGAQYTVRERFSLE